MSPEHTIGEMSHRYAVILAADVAQYSRLMERDSEATVRALQRCRAEFQRCITAFHGREFGSVGDSLMAEFQSPIEALRAARDCQQRMASLGPANDHGEKLTLKIGLHAGDVILEGDTLFGDVVNIAARLQAMARPGEIVLSNFVYRQVRKEKGCSFRSLGKHRLKNIAEPVLIYRVDDQPGFSLRRIVLTIEEYKPAIAATLGVFLAGILIVAYLEYRGQPAISDKTIAVPDDNSIAVLAFENSSNDPDREFFSDGVSEEILNLLAGIEQLKVIARTSSFSFKGKSVPIAEIAEKLNVRYVVEGSVRRSGNQVRITAQLIDAADSSHVWSKVFERELTAENLFFIEAEIAHAIAGRLTASLTQNEEERLTGVPTKNTEAYEAYLLGRRNLYGGVGTFAMSVSQFARAIELDPDFAAAYAGLAEACLQYHQASSGKIAAECPQWSPETIGSWDQVPMWDRYFRRLEPLARKAIELDPGLGEAWIALGMTLSGPFFNANPETADEARIAYERGVELSPSYARGYAAYAKFLRGEPRETTEEWVAACEAKPWVSIVEKGLEIDPLSLELRHTALAPRISASYEASMAHARKMVEIAPYALDSNVMLGAIWLEGKGRVDEALRWWNKAASLGWHRWLNIGIPHGLVLVGDYDAAIADIETAITLVEETTSGAQRASDSWSFNDVSFLEVVKGAAHLYAGRLDEAEAVFEALVNDADTHPGHRWWAWQRLIGLAYVRGGPQAAIDRYRDLELTPRGAPEDSCFAQEIGNELDHCDKLLVPMMRATGSPDWGQSIVQDAEERLDEDRPSCNLRSSLSRLIDLAVAGRNEEAIQFFTESVAAGELRGAYTHAGRDWQLVAYFRPSLHVIRQDPRFQAAVAEIEADMAEQRANVQAMRESGEIRTLAELYPDKPAGL